MFSDKPQDNLEEKIKILEEFINENTEKLEHLPERGTAAATDQAREQIEGEIRQAELQVLDIKETAQQQGRDVDGYDISADLFGD